MLNKLGVFLIVAGVFTIVVYWSLQLTVALQNSVTQSIEHVLVSLDR